MSNKLVLFYSRTGTTKQTAEMLANILDCDIAEIVSKKKFRGPIGWLSAGRTAMAEKDVNIVEPEITPENYELVILCSPVWASRTAPPAKTWLSQNYVKCSKLVYLLTFGGSGDNKAFEQLERIGGKAAATISFSDKERKDQLWAGKLKEFADKL
ncbi:MAG: flavodoxin [Spirochaetales bacterium]|nr:flavodoxin [Spirochaetales bacterium]